MIEIIPSNQMREYYKSIGFEFSDFQKATLIWNAPNYKRKEILDSLKELADITEDDSVRKQILERLFYEEKAMGQFLDNTSGEAVYVVEDRADGCSCGFFAIYELAEAYAYKYMTRYDTRCRIEKQNIMREEDNEYKGEAVASVELNRDAGVVDFVSQDGIQEKMKLFAKERFENSFIEVPFNLEEETVVRDVVSRKYYLLATGKKKWKEYQQKIKERKEYADFSDVQVMVYELDEKGRWRHCHINPMYLEQVSESDSEYWEQKRRYRRISEDIRYKMYI